MPTRAARLNALICRIFKSAFSSALLLSAIPFCVYAEVDPYLSAISQEAQKVETPAAPAVTETGEPGTDDGLSLQAFEEDLKARYKGRYTFYQKLPRRTREEVFQEYRDGASIDEIRKKIMDRFLHQ